MQLWLGYLLLLLIGITGGLGDIWIYLWARSDRPVWLLLASVVWLISLVLFGLFLRFDSRGLGTAFMLSSVLHIGLVIAFDQLFTSARMNRLEWAGLFLAVLAVLLLELGHGQHEDPTSGVPEGPPAENANR